MLDDYAEEVEQQELNYVDVDEIPQEYSDDEDGNDDDVEWYTEDEEEVDPDVIEPEAIDN